MLQFSELKKRNLLSNESMIKVHGGAPTGTCCYMLPNGTVASQISKSEALDAVSEGGHWCCDSCWKVEACN